MALNFFKKMSKLTKIKFSLISCLLIAAVLFSPSLFARTESTNYVIYADVFSAGGSEGVTSSNYGIQDTIGEAVILSATSTSSNYGIKAGFRELYADNFVTFTSGSSAVNLGTLSASAASTDSHTLVISTNATNGFSITMTASPTTLTSGSDTITAIGATAAASAVGSEQFGINLAANTTPAVGANPSGTSPIGSAASQYNTANSFAFNSGATIASASSSINQTTFTVSYLANISSATENGTYTTTITYSATGNF